MLYGQSLLQSNKSLRLPRVCGGSREGANDRIGGDRRQARLRQAVVGVVHRVILDVLTSSPARIKPIWSIQVRRRLMITAFLQTQGQQESFRAPRDWSATRRRPTCTYTPASAPAPTGAVGRERLLRQQAARQELEAPLLLPRRPSRLMSSGRRREAPPPDQFGRRLLTDDCRRTIHNRNGGRRR